MKRSLSIDVKVGEAVSIDGGRVVVTLEEKSGQRIRMRFEADEGTPIERVKNRHNVRAEIGLGERKPQGS